MGNNITNKILKLLVAEFGLKHTKDLAVDLVGKCPVTLRAESNAVFVRFPIEENLYQQLPADLALRLKEFKIKAPTYKNGIMAFLITNLKHARDGYAFLRSVIGDSRAGSAPCPYCGMTGCDEFAVAGDTYAAVHARCHAQGQAEAQEKLLGQGNYFTGLLGAIGGSLLMLVISLVLILMLETSYGWLFLMATPMAVVGYKALKGPHGTAGAFIVAICSILAFLIFNYSEVIIVFVQQGLALSAGNFIATVLVASYYVFSAEWIGASWFEIAFFLIGLVGTLATRPLSKKKAMKAQEELAALTTPLAPTLQGQGYAAPIARTNESSELN